MLLSETMLFVFSMAVNGMIVFLLIYFIITLSDLECDYINAQTCCRRLNGWTMPKIIAQAVVTLFLLIHGNFWLFGANVPMLTWAFYEVCTVPKGNMGVYDPTEIYNRGQLKLHTRDVLIQITFYLFAFFVYMYSMILAMLKADPITAGSKPSNVDFPEEF